MTNILLCSSLLHVTIRHSLYCGSFLWGPFRVIFLSSCCAILRWKRFPVVCERAVMFLGRACCTAGRPKWSCFLLMLLFAHALWSSKTLGWVDLGWVDLGWLRLGCHLQLTCWLGQEQEGCVPQVSWGHTPQRFLSHRPCPMASSVGLMRSRRVYLWRPWGTVLPRKAAQACLSKSRRHFDYVAFCLQSRPWFPEYRLSESREKGKW